MTEDQLTTEAQGLGPWHRHRFVILIGMTILISLFLVSVALALYASSGAAQLDLSRPGYTSVRDKVDRSDSFEGFSASGSVNKDTLDKFRELYQEQAEKATNYDSFGGDVMSDKTLSIDAPAK
jgi:hypothetical protein